VIEPALTVLSQSASSPNPFGNTVPGSICPGLPTVSRKVVAIEATVQKAPSEVIAQETLPLGA